MKANEAPEKIYIDSKAIGGDISTTIHTKRQDYPTCTEYTCTDVSVEKARKWFEQQPELYDANGVRVYGKEDFEDFKKYMEGGKYEP